MGERSEPHINHKICIDTGAPPSENTSIEARFARPRGTGGMEDGVPQK